MTPSRIATVELARRRFIGAAIGLPFFWAAQSSAAGNPKFIGKVVTEWLDGGRMMRLLQPFEFIDVTGRRWPVPPGTDVDGASIPKAFWSFIGGPFEGRYRSASVIHDYFCDVKTRPYPEVHKVFYDGMLTSGVDKSTAYIMYKAVDVFGPRWETPSIPKQCEIVTEKYDFGLCARNSAPANLQPTEVTKDSLDMFIEGLNGKVDKSKIESLRSSLTDYIN